MKSEEDHRNTYRILSIDGGGILGAYPASFLASIEEHRDRPIGEYFDLISGTSTGGIIAIGLAMGLRASEISDLYQKRGAEIFGQHHHPVLNFLIRKLKWVRRFYRHKHSSDKLREVLTDVLGEKQIGDAKTRLVIPAWNPVARNVYIYKTAHHDRLRNDYKVSAVDVALATSSAPTFFARHIGDHDVGLLDGGVWANNPIAIAVVEAVTLLGWPADRVHVLSLGCLEETYTIPGWAGIGTLGAKAVKLFMDGQSRGAHGIAKLLTGHEHQREAIFRVNHSVPYGRYALDDTRVVRELNGLGHTHAREWYERLHPVFFTQPAEPFTPVYKLSERSTP
jgi:patatin-like phospholipase/acyl hydrolase